jgi:hypothetical protein
MQVGLVGWPGRVPGPPPVLLRTFRFPALVKRVGKIVGLQPMETPNAPLLPWFPTPTDGVLQTLIGLFLFRAFLTCQRTMWQSE